MHAAKVEYFPEASQELEDAFGWYLDRSAQAAESFLKEIDRALALIAGEPTIWPQFEADTRRYVLNRFSYSIIFRETDWGIQVIAVAHQKRRPHYWHGRLKR